MLEQSTLSAEQEAAVGAALGNASRIRIKAYAGTGKSTTLRAIGQRKAGRGIYLVFSKANQIDAEKKFPTNVKCMTTHGLAYRNVIRTFQKSGKPFGAIHLGSIRQMLGLDGQQAMSNSWVVRQALTNYCNSADAAPGHDHIPEITRKVIGAQYTRQYADPEMAETTLSKHLDAYVEAVNMVWEAMTDPHNQEISLSHDGYLKLWSLSGPRIGADFLLLDEAQDTNPCVLTVLKQFDGQLIVVGDPYQAIFGWRGAVNAMECFDGEARALTHTFRFGENLAGPANAVLRLLGEREPLVGAASNPGRIGACDVQKTMSVITRTNAVAALEAYKVCEKAPTAVVGGVDDFAKLLESGYALKKGWVDKVSHLPLRQFRSWDQLTVYVERTQDAEMKMLVRLVSEMGEGIQGLVHTLRTRLVDECQAQIVISTAHKAKGREWSQVRLGEDFPDLTDSEGKMTASTEELNLLYVAATRARSVLQPNQCLMEALDLDRRGQSRLSPNPPPGR